MLFKYHDFTIDTTDFDAYIREALLDYMWEERYEDYHQYMAMRRESFEAEDRIQREEYNSSYNISFGMECAEEDYAHMLKQKCAWIINRWQERFNGIQKEEKAPRKRKNALTGRL